MKAIFLDRDGVINPLIDSSKGKISPQSLEDFNLFEGVRETLRQAKEEGFAIIVFTNQPDVQKAWRELNEQKLESINKFLTEIGVDGIYSCKHGPLGGKEDKHYQEKDQIIVCDCRKPQPGLIERALEDFNIDFSSSYVIGDNYKDLEAASRFEKERQVNFKAKFSVSKELENAGRTFDNVNTAINKIIEDDQV